MFWRTAYMLFFTQLKENPENEEILKLAKTEFRQTVGYVIDNYNEKTLRNYLDDIVLFDKKSFPFRKGCIPKEIISRSIANVAAQSIGKEMSDALYEQTLNTNLLLTSNHMQIDSWPHMLHGNKLVEYIYKKANVTKPIIPAISTTLGKLKSESHAMGLNIWHSSAGRLRVGLFPHSMRSITINCARAFSKEELISASQKLEHYKKNGTISDATNECAQYILNECCGTNEILNSRTYSEQALLCNRNIQKKVFCDDSFEILYLSMEEIASKILIELFKSEDNLISKLFFEDNNIEKFYHQMNGAEKCWDINREKGTFIFWRLHDNKLKRLILIYDGGIPFLKDTDDETLIPFDKHSLTQCLENNELVPALFTSLLVLSFLSPYTLLSGMFQRNYSKNIIKKLCAALSSISGFDDAIEFIKSNDDIYISGMLITACSDGEKHCLSGPVECLEAGGINDDYFNECLNISVLQAQRNAIDMLKIFLK